MFYTPNAGFTGTDAFTYRVTDGAGNFAMAVVSIVVSQSGSTTPTATLPPTPAGTASAVPSVSAGVSDETAAPTARDGNVLAWLAASIGLAATAGAAIWGAGAVLGFGRRR